MPRARQAPPRRCPHHLGRRGHQRLPRQPRPPGPLGNPRRRHPAGGPPSQRPQSGGGGLPERPGAGAGAAGLGLPLRPNRRRQNQPALLRGPVLSAHLLCRRPHRRGHPPDFGQQGQGFADSLPGKPLHHEVARNRRPLHRRHWLRFRSPPIRGAAGAGRGAGGRGPRRHLPPPLLPPRRKHRRRQLHGL